MLVQLQPLPIRIFHWVLFFCIILLLGSGFLLNEPREILQAPFRQLRQVHMVAGYLLLLNLFFHLYYYRVSRRFSEILPLPKDWGNVPSFLRYMLFITEAHPNYGRYNPGQKLIFSSWFVVQAVAGITGGLLLFPDAAIGLQKLLGGLLRIRTIHYFVAIYFSMTIPLHLYLVFFENPAKLQAMFTGYVKKEPPPGCIEKGQE